jgi:hypothetical protein
VNICPQGFEILKGKAKIKDENANCIIETANSCPRGAIILEENKNQEEASIRQSFRIGFINGIRVSFGRGGIFKTGSPIIRHGNRFGHRGNKGIGRRRHLK